MPLIYWENLRRKNSERKIATDDDREKRGDMVGLLDSEDAEVVSYRYSSWGKILETVDTSDNQIAARNPFRYRGYILDEETGMYYLKSRYYDPETGRFLNADSQLNIGNHQGYNLYIYCNDNPVNLKDPIGKAPFSPFLGDIFRGKFKKAKKFISFWAENLGFYVIRGVEKVKETIVFENKFLGKIKFSSSVITQSREPATLYRFVEAGTDEVRGGIGVNKRRLKLEIGMSSAGYLYVTFPSLLGHIGGSIGIDGIGLNVGFDVKDTSYDFDATLGWGSIALLMWATSPVLGLAAML